MTMNTDLIKQIIKASFPGVSIVECIEKPFSSGEVRHTITLWCSDIELGYTRSSYDTDTCDLYLFEANTGCFTTETGSALIKKLRSEYLRLV